MAEKSTPNIPAGRTGSGVSIGDVHGNIVNSIIAGGDVTQYTFVFQQALPQRIDPQTLAGAGGKLATLPLDTLPAIAALPPGSRMLFPPNPHFVGREADLKSLAGMLKDGRTVVVTGLGGIGKTQVAAEFAHRYGQYFQGGVFRLNMADPVAVPAEVAACGAALTGQPGFEALPFEQQIGLVASAWQSEMPRLLIFDNCEDEAVLARWRPKTGACRVLVTSRRGMWSKTLGVQALRLGVLNRAESVALLRKHRPDLADGPAEAIAADLGDLPLALHLAGSFLAAYQYTVTPEQYLAQLGNKALLDHTSLQGRGADWSPTEHEQNVARTFALSYEKLDISDETDAPALKLLGRAACFAAGEPIPRPLLLKTINLPHEDPDAPLRIDDALRRLVGLGLLEAEAAGSLVLHRLVAAFITQAAPNEGAREAVETALLAEAERLNAAGYSAPLLAWQPHLRAVTDVAQARADERAARLCNELGYHLRMVGDYAGARPYYERALFIREEALGEKHPDTALSLNNLGFLLKAMGDYAGARPYYERALAIDEQVLGAQHPHTATDLSNLGMLLQAMGDYAGAQNYLERALAINEQVLGAQHPHTATCLNNLGLLLDNRGDYAGARSCYERALAIDEQVLGAQHPHTATDLNNLGTVLYAMSDYVEARPYLERALAIRQQESGPKHPDTAQSLNNLGMLLRAMGDYAGARPYYEQALAVNEQSLGPEHPDTAISLSNLGTLCYYEGDYAASAAYMRRALVIREARLGANHPDTQSARQNLQVILAQLGEPNYTPDELQEALRPIVSLINKSEKAQLKLAPGTWQHTMLRDNLKALHIASALMNKKTGDINSFAGDDLQEALRACASMISRTAKVQTKFTPGTSPHTLQQNRLKALQIAEALIKAALDKG